MSLTRMGICFQGICFQLSITGAVTFSFQRGHPFPVDHVIIAEMISTAPLVVAALLERYL